jgi:Fe-S cluster biogenesis protein NfuA
MQGSCGGCPMSTATLTLGIEAELRRAIPEVEGVITV